MPGAARRPVAWGKPRVVVPDEHHEQKLLVRTLDRLYPGIAAYVTAVPNGGGRSKATAGILKAEGVRKGYPDLVIDCPRGPFHGLRVEMKRQKKSLSTVAPEQREWGQRLNDQGVLAVLARGCQHALDQILYYWSLGEFDPGCVVQMSRFERLEAKGDA